MLVPQFLDIPQDVRDTDAECCIHVGFLEVVSLLAGKRRLGDTLLRSMTRTAQSPFVRSLRPSIITKSKGHPLCLKLGKKWKQVKAHIAK